MFLHSVVDAYLDNFLVFIKNNDPINICVQLYHLYML